jgi:hypothetical protein
MPTFNAEEVAVTASLAPRELEVLARMLRSIVRSIQETHPSLNVTLRV